MHPRNLEPRLDALFHVTNNGLRQAAHSVVLAASELAHGILEGLAMHSTQCAAENGINKQPLQIQVLCRAWLEDNGCMLNSGVLTYQ